MQNADSKPVDSQYHKGARVSGSEGRTKHDTSVWKFRDIRSTKASIYRGGEGLAWAIADLAKRTNSAIDRGEIPGHRIEIGDVVQACVVSYFDGQVHKPQTTEDSPKYATLPYEVAVAEGGYWTAKPAIPPEAVVHFNIPQTVGELVPGLAEEKRAGVLVSLQLKEALHGSSKEQLIREVEKAAAEAQPPEYDISDKGQEEAADFLAYLESEGARGAGEAPSPSRTPAGTEEQGGGPSTEEKTRQTRERISRRLQRLDTDDFGFGV